MRILSTDLRGCEVEVVKPDGPSVTGTMSKDQVDKLHSGSAAGLELKFSPELNVLMWQQTSLEEGGRVSDSSSAHGNDGFDFTEQFDVEPTSQRYISLADYFRLGLVTPDAARSWPAR